MRLIYEFLISSKNYTGYLHLEDLGCQIWTAVDRAWQSDPSSFLVIFGQLGGQQHVLSWII
jgi:hypothetical protein